jgi:aminopeptidase
MKPFKALSKVIIGSALLLCTYAYAENLDYDTIADNLVNQSLAVQSGEIVVINGGPNEIDLMGAIQVAVSKAGGQPVLNLSLPEANKRAIMETSMEDLQQLPTAGLMLTKMADAFINVGSIQDPALFADVPEDRLAAARQSGVPLMRAFNNMRYRSVNLGQTGGIPTVAYAKSVAADHQVISDGFWKAVGTSPDELAPKATAIATMMKDGAKVRITSPAGTDLTLSVDQFPTRTNVGRTADVQPATGPSSVWLPAGEAYTSTKDANGVLVIPWTSFRGNEIKNLKLTFKNGEMTELSADSNAKVLKDYFAASSPKLKHLSLISLGLNPNSKSPAGSHFFSWEMGGMVTIVLGNNSWAGGDNDSDAGATFHAIGTSLSIDGKAVIENGSLL